jgi:hypothetical protein
VAVAAMQPSASRVRIVSTAARARSGWLSVFAIRAVKPASARASSMPRTIGGNSGLVRSGSSTAIVNERLVLRLRAIGLGV